MKKPIQTTFIFIAIWLIASSVSCKQPTKKGSAADEKFTAELIGTYMYVGPDTLQNMKCTDSLLNWRVIVDATGTSNIMGEVIAHFDFCSGQNGKYGDTYAYLVDQNSDTLFINCEGTVIQGKTTDHPEYVTTYWKDQFTILGGTGVYREASGIIETDDYNSSEDANSHHFWKGNITLKK